MNLTPQAIEGYKQYTERIIQSAQYRIGSTFHDVPIHRRERLPDGRLGVYMSITPGTPGTVTISEVRLLDSTGNVWASNTENIVISGSQQGILYRFTFEIKEV